MRKIISIAWMAVLLVASSCSTRELDIEPQQETVVTESGICLNTASLQSGRMRIYVSEEMAERLEADPDSFAAENPGLKITGIHRTFPDAGEFEERSREAGLHRWWDVEFDKELPLTKAGSGLRSAHGVCRIEYRPKIRRRAWSNASWKHRGDAVNATHGILARPGSSLPFNDPYLGDQWHYLNSGGEGFKAGCDVNVVPVWQNYRCGSEDVIVAVVDGGIDFRHEDLRANMWLNPDQSGDKAYGYNFLDNNYRVTAEEHGTHVAGTISAVNNNGKGVCGIAGGDYAHGIPGVKLMSCQIFEQGSDDSGDDVPAIKWAADHGAVICQNSWGYDEIDVDYMPESTKEAIDYFNKYAGCDKQGNQTGPMRGGLVVFAAGNERTGSKVYPASYEGVLGVSALGPDFRLASYSNYGHWVDLAAPGGDDDFEILSTLPDNEYDWFSGTSMAAPHVSGVAALVIANMGGEGFTRDNLIDILLRHTTDISEYNSHRYPGVGLVNAYKAIADDTGSVPYTISGVSAQAGGRIINATISAQEGEEGGNGWVSGARIYCSETPFSTTDGVFYFNCPIRSECEDGPFELATDFLNYDTSYWVAFMLYDEFGNLTPLSEVLQVNTESNLPPTITPKDELDNLTVFAHETIVLEYTVSDPGSDDVSVTLDSTNPKAVSMAWKDETVKVTINGPASQPGSYSFTITAKDEFGLTTVLTVPFKVVENHPPVLTAPIDDMIVAGGDNATVDLSQHFSDPDDEPLYYTIKSDNPSVIKASLSDVILKLIPQKYGYAGINVVAADYQGKSVECTFRLLVRDQSVEVELYPNPTTDGRLWLRVGKELAVDYNVQNAAGSIIVSGSATIDPFAPHLIDLSAYPAGVYIVNTATAGESSTRKIVKL